MRRRRLTWGLGLFLVAAGVAVIVEVAVYHHSGAAPAAAGSTPSAPSGLPSQPAPPFPAVTDPKNGELLDQNGTRWIVQTPAKPWSMMLSPTYDRFEVRGGDSWSHDLKNGKVVKNRAELQGPPLVFGTDYWLAWSLRIPRSSALSTRDTVVGQLHASADRADVGGRGALVEVRLVGRTGRFVVRTRSDPALTSTTHAPPVLRYNGGPVPRDRWINIVMSLRFNRTGNGHLFFWLDGKLVVNQPAIPLGYNDAQGPYWKFGNYRPAAPETSVVEYANMTVSRSSLAARITKPLPPGGP